MLDTQSLKDPNHSLFFLIISALIHALIIGSALLLPTPTTKKKNKDEHIQIEYLKKTPLILNNDIMKLKNDLLRLKDKAQVLSAHTQRVKQQQQPPPQITTRPDNSLSKSSKKEKNQKSKTLSSSWQPLLHNTTGQVFIDKKLPNVKTGFFKSLNTDTAPFYAFYSRINREIGNRWVQNVFHFKNQIDIIGLQDVSKKVYITELEVLIDAKGNLIDILIHKSSGHNGVDQTSIQAFVQSTPYINPPKELLSKDDGLIHLYYSFHIHWHPPRP